uniref:Uncharacterized protein n=1 Tax=Mycobacterium riyadhense TaxID=486698 RepID=A0A653F3E0_9MYCO|nr:hypothetical protein BIN_B_05115 [Mycobacterium riyadhense]
MCGVLRRSTQNKAICPCSRSGYCTSFFLAPQVATSGDVDLRPGFIDDERL